ncbi:MAG TPA: DNA-3-methyladenine glycosylase 2 family protein [Thermoanaerobaculia bacterium]|nr:DNA-3-methyladenine glycosylase 2 family protein [Thermoanaerobaculia bacterium]
MPRRRVPLFVPLDAVRTLASKQVLADPGLRCAGREIAYATRTPDGPATVVIAQRESALDVEAWGPGADLLLERLPALVGLEDVGADDFTPASEPLRTLRRRHPGLRLPRTGAVLETLVPAVLGQQVSGKEAGRSLLRLTRALGQPAPGPAGLDLWLPPSAATLAGLGYEQLHRFGVERRRADIVREVARRHSRLEEVAALDREAAWRRLLAIRGVGPWTAALVMRTVRGDADAVPLGDYNLPSLVAWNLAGERRADDRRMLELLAPHAGHRARVVQLLQVAGSAPPRRGPRLPLRAIDRS